LIAELGRGGIAKRASDTATTGSGFFVGSLEYTTPERIR
jgi:hypothetical protein